MIKVQCHRCGGKAEGNSFDEASELIDHAIGMSNGKKCYAGLAQIDIIGGEESKVEYTKPKVEYTKPKKTKSKAKPETSKNTFNSSD